MSFSTNAFSPENIITNNLMNQALRNNRDRNAALFKTSREDSDSDDEGNTSKSQNYIAIENHLFPRVKNKQTKMITKAASEHTSLLPTNIKPKPSIKNSSSLRHKFSCCCIQ